MAGGAQGASLDRVGALVLTYRRPKLATEVVRGLIEREGLSPERVLLVVNGEGGLDDPLLESEIAVLRLDDNLGPAGGYREGLLHALDVLGGDWLYICEDDVGLFDLPTPRLAGLLERIERLPRDGADPVGAVVAYGRDLNPRTGITTPHRPGAGDFDPVDVAAWGATLLSLDVVRSGVLPDGELFFGYEDFDFWLRMRTKGFRLLLDNPTARAVERNVLDAGREEAHAGRRPVDAQEPWRRYYEARNFFHLARRHGHLGWTLMHGLKTLRRMQVSATAAHRSAAARGFWDGLRGRNGKNPAFLRQAGELDG